MEGHLGHQIIQLVKVIEKDVKRCTYITTNLKNNQLNLRVAYTYTEILKVTLIVI